jgi:hypothetical protein
VEECGPCPLFASFTLAFALQLRKKHGKTSVRVRKTSKYSIHITKKPHTHTTKQYKTTTVQIKHKMRIGKTTQLGERTEPSF